MLRESPLVNSQISRMTHLGSLAELQLLGQKVMVCCSRRGKAGSPCWVSWPVQGQNTGYSPTIPTGH